MTEFNNRIAAQRRIVSIVNDGPWHEELYGLSSGAIDRWERANSSVIDGELSDILRELADKLFFLSNKSQEQITEEYSDLMEDISALTEELNVALEEVNHRYRETD